jgi:hypothetical protein|tara:strand:+ start:3922 stop:5460 length:1539 start_codon:yes stop_codon:yes gene_type:complete
MKSAESYYLKCESERQSVLERARDASRLTLPTLIPEEGVGGSTRFPTPYQSVGARGVNSLSSALLMTLLPANAPFFRLLLDSKAKREVQGMEQVESEIDSALADIEREIMREVESNNFRVGLFEALKHLIVGGNVLIHVPEEGGMRVFHLNRYVVKRDPMGNVDKIITKESVSPSHLSDDILEALDGKLSDEDSIDLYTCISSINDTTYEVFQEIKGVRLEGSYGTYPKDKLPYLALGLNKVDGEDYARGFVEQYQGDLESLEGLSTAIVQGAAASAKVLFMVAPNGTTRKRTLAQSSNGAIVEGNAADVTTLQVQKHADFRVALETINQIVERLNYAFMLTESSIRKAERVTAEEVRLVTQSLERQLGGVYSVLSQEFQLPLVSILMNRMEKANRLPKLPKGLVTPVVVTGIDALGRGQDLNKLDSFVAGIGQVLGPQVVSQYVNVSEYLERRASALGIETDGLIRSQEEIQAEMQQAQQMQMMQKLGPEAMKSATSVNNTQAQIDAQESA